MGMNHWNEDVRASHVDAYGEALGEVYSTLSSDVAELHRKWLEYRELFAGSHERIQLLNDCAGGFFGTIQDIVWRDVLLHISRLTDPEKQGSCKNLTLSSLPSLIEDDRLRMDVLSSLEEVKLDSQFARDYRNKILAHSDVRHAMGKVESLSPGSRADIEKVLSGFSSILNMISGYYCDSDTAYSMVFTGDGAEALLFWLALGRSSERAREERIRSGTCTMADFEDPEIP